MNLRDPIPYTPALIELFLRLGIQPKGFDLTARQLIAITTSASTEECRLGREYFNQIPAGPGMVDIMKTLAAQGFTVSDFYDFISRLDWPVPFESRNDAARLVYLLACEYTIRTTIT